MKRKILNIIDDTKIVIQSLCKEKFWIDWYGAYEIDAKNLVIWICVETDATKLRLESDRELIIRLKELLTKYDYPEEARSSVHIGFESQETVDRESNGSWYEHFK